MDSAADQLLGYGNLVAFANGQVITHEQLEFIKKLALRDSVVDDHERTVLQHLFDRIDAHNEDPAVWQEIVAFRQRYNIH